MKRRDVGVDVVGKKVFIKLRSDGVEMVFSVVARDLPIAKEQIIPRDAMGPGIDAREHGRPGGVGEGGKHGHRLPHRGAFRQDDAIAA